MEFNLEGFNSAIAEVKKWLTVKPIADVFKAKEKKLAYLKANWWRLWPSTPFPILDKLTKGIKKWWVMWIGAFSNTWKSQLSYHYVQHWLKQWLKVTYFSLEVDSVDVLTYIQQYYHNMTYKEAIQKNSIEWLENLTIYDTSDVDWIEQIEEYVLTNKPDIIVIDFIQILNVPGWSEYEKMSEWIRRLQKLGIQSWTTIVYLSQMSNESAKEKDVLQANLKGAWNLIASSDYIFVLKRTDSGEIEMWIKKNKHW